MTVSTKQNGVAVRKPTGLVEGVDLSLRAVMEVCEITGHHGGSSIEPTERLAELVKLWDKWLPTMRGFRTPGGKGLAAGFAGLATALRSGIPDPQHMKQEDFWTGTGGWGYWGPALVVGAFLGGFVYITDQLGYDWSSGTTGGGGSRAELM